MKLDKTLLNQVILEVGPQSKHEETAEELSEIESVLEATSGYTSGTVAALLQIATRGISNLPPMLLIISALYFKIGYEYARREAKVSHLESLFKES